jgi:hypothetical protein
MEVDMARKVIDCTQGHASIKIYGNSDDELVKNAQEHLKQYHPGLTMTREQVLAMAQPA